MSATLQGAKEIVRRYAGSRVRVDCGDCTVEGRLRRNIRHPKDGEARFVVFGRASNWREYAEQFKACPETYRKALRSAARPGNIYIRVDAADRIELVGVAS